MRPLWNNNYYGPIYVIFFFYDTIQGVDGRLPQIQNDPAIYSIIVLFCLEDNFYCL